MKFSAKHRNGCRGFNIRRLASEEGSFTLEATAIFPVILMLVLALMLFGLYMYQKSILYYSASIASERAAFRWDNSKRGADGIPDRGADDGLYWRMSGDEMLQSLLGLSGEASAAVLGLPAARTGDGGPEAGSREGSLAQVKLLQSASWLPASWRGEIGYTSSLPVRRLETTLVQPVTIAPLEKLLGRSRPQSSATATVVDPVEFIRTVDLVRYYSAKFAGGAADRQQAGEALAGFASGRKEGAAR